MAKRKAAAAAVDLEDREPGIKRQSMHWAVATADALAATLLQSERAQQQAGLLVARNSGTLLVMQQALNPLIDIRRRIQKFWTTIRAGGFEPWHYQEIQINWRLVVSMRWWVGEDYERYKPFILRELGWTEPITDVLVVMGRQNGKTDGLCELEAASAVHVPRRCCLFSPGLRNSVQDMRLIQAAVRRKIPPEQHKQRIVVANSDRLVVEVEPLDGKDDGVRRFSEVRCFPSNAASK